jgi:hypothetical protein
MKKLFMTLLALGAAVLTGLSQGVPQAGTYSTGTVTLPINNLTSSVTATNLYNGWSSVGSNLATSITFSNTTFVTNTTVTYWTNTLYADMPMTQQKNLPIVISEYAGIGTNVYTFGHGLDSSTVDTNNTWTLTIGHVAAGTAMISTNIPDAFNGGFGLVRVLNIAWTPVSTAVWTNNYIKFGIIKGSGK